MTVRQTVAFRPVRLWFELTQFLRLKCGMISYLTCLPKLLQPSLKKQRARQCSVSSRRRILRQSRRLVGSSVGFLVKHGEPTALTCFRIAMVVRMPRDGGETPRLGETNGRV